MRVRTMLKIALVLAAAFAVAAVAVVLNLDPNEHKDRLAAFVEKKTGRKLTLDGPIELRWGLGTRVSFRDAALANPVWAANPELARVGLIEAEFRLFPLLFGDVDIVRLAVRDAALAIETAPSGRSSLEFGGRDDDDGRGDDDGRDAEPADGFAIADLAVENMSMTYFDASGTGTEIALERLTALQSAEDGSLDIDARANVRRRDDVSGASLRGRVGSWDAILRGDRRIPLDLKGEGFGLSVEISGDVRGPGNPDGFDIDVLASGDGLAKLQPFMSATLPDVDGVSLSAHIGGDRGRAVVDVAFLDIADTRVTGTASVGPSGAAALELRADLENQDLGPLAPYTDIPLAQFGPLNGRIDIAGGPASLRIEPKGLAFADSRVTGTVMLAPLADAAVTYDLVLETDGQSLRPVEPIVGVSIPIRAPFRGALRAVGDLEKAQLELTDVGIGRTRASGRIGLDGLSDGPDMSFDVELVADAQPLEEFGSLLGEEIAALGAVSGTVRVTGAPDAMRLDLFGLSLDRTRATGELELDLSADDPVTRFGLDISAGQQSPEPLRSILGADWPELDPVDLAVRVEGDPSRFSFENLVFRGAGTDLAGRGRIALDAGAPEIEAELRSKTLDLTRLLPESGPPARDGRERARGPTPRPRPPLPGLLPLQFLRTAGIDLLLEAQELVTPYGIYAGAHMRLALRDDVLRVRPLAAAYGGSELDGDLLVDARAAPPLASASVRLPDVQVGALLRDFAGLDVIEGRGVLDIAVSATGATVPELVGNLKGHARLLMGEGRMRNEGLGYVSGVFSGIGEILGGREWVAVNCMANDFAIENGIAESKVNLLNTDVIVLTAEGRIDLSAREYDLRINPSPSGLDLSLAVPVTVTGPLDDPSVGPDVIGTSAKLGTLLGSVMFPPAALIGLVDLGSGEHPCVELAGRIDNQGFAAPPPGSAGPPPRDVPGR